MRTISTALRTELESGTPRIARTVKITYKDGTVIGYSDHDHVLTVDGVQYDPAPGLKSVSYTATADTSVSNQRMGAGWLDIPEADLRGGRVDNASIEAAWCSWADPSAGRLITFQGKIGEITWDESGFSADIVSFMKELERNIGWTYTANCRHQLFSQPHAGSIGACMADPTAYTFTGTVASVITPKWKFTVSGAASGRADGYFSAGLITFTSGLNMLLSTTVKTQVGNTFELFLPTAFTVPVGTTFSVQAGCDKTFETCKAKFSNTLNFGGFPHINPNVQYR